MESHGRLPGALLLAAMIVLMPEMGTEPAHAAEAVTEAKRLRILSYNIRIGRGMDDRIDLERIAAVIKRVEPDLVSLQEVDNHTTRTGNVDQAAEIGRRAGMAAVFGKAREVAGGEYGNAILSRYPIVESKVHPLPQASQREPRSALAVRVRLRDDSEMLLVATHFDHVRDSEDRPLQADQINELFAADDELPKVLAGDLNDRPDSVILARLLQHWTNATADEPLPTFPAPDPTRQIDYILYRPAGAWRVVEAKVIEEPMASDHRPLLVVLEAVK